MELTYNDFRDRAKDPNLSKWEKIGFPDAYRKDTERFIFQDIKEKLDLDNAEKILDIGCGCSELVEEVIKFSHSGNKELFLVDSPEILNCINKDLPKGDKILQIPGYFPNLQPPAGVSLGNFDAIILYSVIQYPFLEGSIYKFIHACVDLLATNGRLLIGDIPNFSKRERFLNSPEGQQFQTAFLESDSKMKFDHINSERIDDAIIFSILQRYRNFNCETYLLEQKQGLPFANRREDILIVKR